MTAVVPYSYGIGANYGAGDPALSFRFKEGSIVDKIRGLLPTYARNDSTDLMRRIVRKPQVHQGAQVFGPVSEPCPANTPYFLHDLATGQCLGLYMGASYPNRVTNTHNGLSVFVPPNAIEASEAIPKLFPECALQKHTRDTGTGDTNCGGVNFTGAAVSTTFRDCIYVWIPSGQTITKLWVAIEGAGWSFVAEKAADLAKTDQWQQIWGAYTTDAATTTGTLVARFNAAHGSVFYSQMPMVHLTNVPRPDLINFAGSVTSKAAETFLIPLTSLPAFNTAEGTAILRCGLMSNGLSGTIRFFMLSDGTANNYVRITSNGTTNISSNMVTGGVSQASVTATNGFIPGPDGLVTTVATTWKDNEFRFFQNTGQVGATDTACTVPTGLTHMGLGVSEVLAGGNQSLFEAFDYYPVALPVADVIHKMGLLA